jgi:hypothetical protein
MAIHQLVVISPCSESPRVDINNAPLSLLYSPRTPNPLLLLTLSPLPLHSGRDHILLNTDFRDHLLLNTDFPYQQPAPLRLHESWSPSRFSSLSPSSSPSLLLKRITATLPHMPIPTATKHTNNDIWLDKYGDRWGGGR